MAKQMMSGKTDSKKRILNWLSDNYLILAVLVLSAVMRIIYITIPTEMWWDASTYMAMGKYFYSLGQSGFNELSRPILWPLILGFFWKVNISMVWAGRILEVIFSMLSIWLVYIIGKKLFSKKAGIIAAIILSFTPLYFQYTNVEITEIPSTFFGLCAIYFVILFNERNFDRKMLVLSGFFAGLSFLARFTQGTVIFALVLGMFAYGLYRRNYYFAFVYPIFVMVGFFFAILPFLIYNQLMFGNPIFSVSLATNIVTQSYSWSWQYDGLGYAYYIIQLLKNNFLFIFAALGIAVFAKKSFSEKNYFSCQTLGIFLMLAIPLAYYSYIDHKIFRFSIVFIPYLALFTGLGIVEAFRWIEGTISGRNIQEMNRYLFLILLLVLLTFSYTIGAAYILGAKWQSTQINDYYTFFDNDEIRDKGALLSTSSVFAAYVDNKVIPLVYWTDAHGYYDRHYNESFAIAIKTCEFKCSDDNTECIVERNKFIDKVRRQNNLIYYKNTTDTLVDKGFCEYMIFEKYGNIVVS